MITHRLARRKAARRAWNAILKNVCACGCVIPAAIVGALVYCFLNRLWLPAGLIVGAAAAAAFFGRKMLVGRRLPLRRR